MIKTRQKTVRIHIYLCFHSWVKVEWSWWDITINKIKQIQML